MNTMEIATPHPSQKMKLMDQNPHQKQNPLHKKENNKQSQTQKMKQISKSATHQFLSNHYAKFPHYEKPAHLLNHYTLNGLVSPYY